MSDALPIVRRSHTLAEIEQQLRSAAAQAAARGDGWAAAEALIESPLLASIPRRLDRKHSSLGGPGAEDALAAAVDALVAHIESGGQIADPAGWLWKVAQNKALDELRRRKLTTELNDELVEALPVSAVAEPSREIVRREALRAAREALPRIHQEQQRRALEVILEGIELEREVTNAEIADRLGVSSPNARVLRNRAFKRLEHAIADAGVELTLEWAFEIEDLELESDDE